MGLEHIKNDKTKNTIQIQQYFFNYLEKCLKKRLLYWVIFIQYYKRGRETTPMATSKSPTCGRVKIPHPQAAEQK